MGQNLRYGRLLFYALCLLMAGCGLSYESRLNEYLSEKQEEARCLVSKTYLAPVTVSGSAMFEKRSVHLVTENVPVPGTPPTNAVELRSMVLGNPLATPLPIRFAEISIYNLANELIQCGRTDGAGLLKAVDGVSALTLPGTAGTFRLRVIARSSIEYGSAVDFTYASVKADRYTNTVHSIESTFASSGVAHVTQHLIARARQTDSENIEGGAFNILNTIQTAFDFIKTAAPLVDIRCLAAKVNVYWKAGFNPMQYLSPHADPQTLSNTSFYLRKTKELFISGGQLGDVSLANTDHFDDFAIIHELAHFIEDHCGQWVSPGGSHTLTARIDQRLAWSEAWANFFGAHVLQNRLADIDPTLPGKFSVLTNDPHGWTYFFNSYGFSDTIQNIGNGDGFMIDFKKSGTNPGSYNFAPYTGQEFDRVNPGIYPGEGHAREGAISRALFKLSMNCGSTCTNLPLTFEEIWKAGDRITGVALANNPFMGSHTFFEKLKAMDPVNWSPGIGTQTRAAVAQAEALHLVTDGSFTVSGKQVWPGYGPKLVTGSSCQLAIQARPDGALNNGSSDQRYSNHFYTIDFGLLPGLTQITINFTKITGSNIDHDVLLFKSGYFFNDDYRCTALLPNGTCNSFSPQRTVTTDIVAANRDPASSISAGFSKTIYLGDADLSQKYLLDVRAWTAGLSVASNTTYGYTITSNLAGDLCPQ